MWIMNQQGNVIRSTNQCRLICYEDTEILYQDIRINVLGRYATEKRAKEVLELIFSNLGSGKEVFRMPKE